MDHAIFAVSRFEPLADETQQTPVTDPDLQQAEEFRVGYPIEGTPYTLPTTTTAGEHG